MFITSIATIIISFLSIILSSSVHEFAHAYSAYKLGDLTAKVNGRMTLNPLKHIAPLGLLSMLVAGIGWSKPVPINENNFEKPVLGTALTALAGPLSNLGLVVIFSIIYRIISSTINFPIGSEVEFSSQNMLSLILLYILEIPIIINLSLMLFNLIPVPPLDGYRITRLFIPGKLKYYWEDLEKYSHWILPILVLPITPIGNIFSSLISNALSFLFRLATGVTY